MYSPPFASAKAGDTGFFPFRHYYGLHHAFWQTRRKKLKKIFTRTPCVAPPASLLLSERKKQAVIGSQRSSRKNSKKRLSAKRRQAQKNYKIHLHDFCVHNHGRNSPTEGLCFF